ncbi:MAG: T9SS type A sorting domain-containing protein [Chlamydiia bacterium]|nr:T9SS type A sorting domain-containing protein [Chlamydiia bacterium]
MKKILLSAALFAVAITGVNAQCVAPTTATTNGNYLDYARIIEGSLLNEANTQIFQSHPAADPTDGIDDKSADPAIELKGDVSYGVGSYGSNPGSGRHLHHTKVFIDFGNDGSFEEAGDEVYASDIAVAFMDGKNTNYAKIVVDGVNIPYKEAFVLTVDAGMVGVHTMRIVSALASTYDAANEITACGPYVDGSIVDLKVDVLDPNSTPPTAAGDSFYTMTGEVAVVDVLANDTQGSNPIVSGVIVENAVNGVAVVLGDKTIEYTPNADYRGVDVFTYKITDDQGLESGVASVKVVVYGKKGDVVIIEDFDISDETLEGKFVDDPNFNWDGSFNQALDWNDSNSILDATKQNSGSFDGFGGTGLSMEIAITNDPDNTANAAWSLNDAHLGRKIDANTSLKFSASDENNVIGMQVMVQKEIAGAKFGLNIKTVDNFEETGAKKVFFLKMDASAFKELKWNLVSFDLSTLTDGEGDPLFGSYTGEFFLHSIGIAADADVTAVDANSAWVFNIDEIGMYPASSLSNAKVELEGVSVYPNPVKNVLNIKAGKDAKVTVLNTIGSTVYEGKAEAINTQSWKKGLYFVVVEEGNKSKTVKVIK